MHQNHVLICRKTQIPAMIISFLFNRLQLPRPQQPTLHWSTRHTESYKGRHVLGPWWPF